MGEALGKENEMSTQLTGQPEPNYPHQQLEGTKYQNTWIDRSILARQHHGLVEFRVRGALEQVIGEIDPKKSAPSSQYAWFLFSMGRAASEYARNAALSWDDFDNLLCDALDVVSNLRLCFFNYEDKDVQLWAAHDPDPIAQLEAKKCPGWDKESLASVAGEYLALPFRCQVIDRFLVRVLVGTEMYGFGNSVLNPSEYEYFDTFRNLRLGHLTRIFVYTNVFWAVLFCGISALGLILNFVGAISGQSAWRIALSCGVLFLIFALKSVFIDFPRAYRNQSEMMGKIMNMLHEMARLYHEVSLDGPMSAAYLRDRAFEVAKLNVVWPAPLFAVLDDIIARGGRF
jgi:hypothetical protein